MTLYSHMSAQSRLRLPLALGVAGMLITGSTAMAWPVLKTALPVSPSPMLASPVLTPALATSDAMLAEPQAVADFVEMTRQQITAPTSDLDLAAPLSPDRAQEGLSVLSASQFAHSAPAPLLAASPDSQMQGAAEDSLRRIALVRPVPRPATGMAHPVTRTHQTLPPRSAPEMQGKMPALSVNASRTLPAPSQSRQAETGQLQGRKISPRTHLWTSGVYR